MSKLHLWSWIALALALAAWTLFVVGFTHDDGARFRLLMLAGIPGVGSQVSGLLGARRAQRDGTLGNSADLPWILGVVPTLPAVVVGLISFIPAPGL